ncbi:MAG TPA: hypothetical protein VGE85_07120 [Terracidiphilus sp.]
MKNETGLRFISGSNPNVACCGTGGMVSACSRLEGISDIFSFLAGGYSDRSASGHLTGSELPIFGSDGEKRKKSVHVCRGWSEKTGDLSVNLWHTRSHIRQTIGLINPGHSHTQYYTQGIQRKYDSSLRQDIHFRAAHRRACNNHSRPGKKNQKKLKRRRSGGMNKVCQQPADFNPTY